MEAGDSPLMLWEILDTVVYRAHRISEVCSAQKAGEPIEGTTGIINAAEREAPLAACS